MLELYHGSNQTIEQIDLALCKPYKDFGRGFYLTDILQQALDMAYRRTRVVGSGIPTVTKYLFDEKFLRNGSLKVLSFDQPSKEWAKFILANRDRKSKFIHDYDVVIGPIADDGVAFQLQKFKDGGITLNELVKELTYKHMNHQYFFGTEKAISLLQRIL
ncbi:MAG TPA: hypothetical protein DDW28_02095 [Prevotella sp.]|nr:hypothetical protein [Candidatus Segatella violae]HCY73650.1 hypothetical protein [Rikenellaceae bacterium]